METNSTTPLGNQAATGLFSRIAGWWKKIIAAFSRATAASPSAATATKTQEDPASIKNTYDNINNEMLHYNKNLLMPEVEQDFLLSVKFMTDSGLGDGVEGIKTARDKEITVIANSRAARLYKLAKVILSGSNSKAKTEESAKRELMERNKQQDSRQHRYLELLQYYRHHHPRSFNGLWGIICLAVGGVLILVDIPLSIKLFEEGFNFRPGQGTPLAIGISLCTIFIKIFYDNYIDLKYGHGLVSRSKFTEMFSSVLAENAIGQQEENEMRNKREQKVKRYWYNGILVFTIVGVIILGIFRVESVKLANQGQLHIGYWIYLLSFIFLSLVFPIISGICLSAGFSVVENIVRHWQTKIKCKRTEQEYIKSLKEYTAAQKDLADVQSEMDKWEKEEHLGTYRDILLSYYDNGYKLGAANPDFGNHDKDFFLLADRWRNRAMARKTNNHIIKISEL